MLKSIIKRDYHVPCGKRTWLTMQYIFVILFFISGCMPTRRVGPPPGQFVRSAVQDSLPEKKVKNDKNTVDKPANAPDTNLSEASMLLIRACDNYIATDSQSEKTIEVLTIKASVYYNNHKFETARSVYKSIIDINPKGHDAVDATKLIAQSYYEEKRFEEAQEWYLKLSNSIPEGEDKNQVKSRIAESIFRLGESLDEQGKYKNAAEQYQRIPMEFPESKLADIALFNAGTSLEKINEWSNAIITYQKLISMFKESKFVPNARFRTARCYETLTQWEQAAKTYLQLTMEHPDSKVASTSLYNAAVCFENCKMFAEAASTLKKFAQTYPNSEEAADALFKAGEIYGQLKDWTSVQNVNQMFMERFGSDKNRVVQALCMTGIALYMQGKEDEALKQLNKTIESYNKQEKGNAVNSYYSARALFTIGEIYTNKMNRIELSFQNHYRQQLAQKSSFLDKAIDAFTNVITIGITEWTTRSIFQAGQSYEDFATGVFKQKRDNNMALDKRLALEFGIIQAVDKYLISKALHYHERNVKFAIEKNIEDQYILKSREKITQLPYIAGQNYLTLAEIASHAENSKNLEGFALISNKLQSLQKIAPFQTRAIDLFLKCLELGTTYQEFNEFYKKTSQGIINISLVTGNAYADVVEIARGAPVPQNFDDYEMLVYKTKLLSQIEGYENEAVTNYLKTIKISSAYDIKDENVSQAKWNIAKILFNRARCYDLLCINVFTNPPFPLKISEEEKEEYKVQFEEIGLKFQEQAFSIYETILDYHNQDIASGEYVIHSYVRLFQNYPEKYGKNITEVTKKAISSKSPWKFSTDSAPMWYNIDFDDSSWKISESSKSPDSIKLSGFPDSIPVHLNLTNYNNDTSANKTIFIYLRQTFQLDNIPEKASFYLATNGLIELYMNGRHISSDSLTIHKNQEYDFTDKLALNKNVIAMKVAKSLKNNVYSFLEMEIKTNELIPESPDQNVNLTLKDVQVDTYKFPEIKNFSF